MSAVPRTRAAAAVGERAAIFAALGDETRLRLVARLCDGGPMSIARLAEREPVTRQAVSKHLRALEDAGLIRSSRAGRERIWELQPARLEAVRRHLDEIARQWDRAVERLRAMVEED